MNNCYIKPLLPTREHLNTQALAQTLSAQTKWAIPEKNKLEGETIEDMEFPGVSKK